MLSGFYFLGVWLKFHTELWLVGISVGLYRLVHARKGLR